MTNVDLVISANGCKDSTYRYLHYLELVVPHLTVVWNENAIGFARACNEGIKKAKTDKIVLLNNDTLSMA
jgi:GT2 family glycosyltransferase